MIEVVINEMSNLLAEIRQELGLVLIKLKPSWLPKLLAIFAQFTLFLLVLADKALAVMYVLCHTIVPYSLVFLLMCWSIDLTLRLITKVRQRMASGTNSNQFDSPLKKFLPVADVPDFPITFVDRGLALLSYSWPLSFLFLYFPKIFKEMDPWVMEFNHVYLRGLVILFGSSKYMPVICLFAVFHGIIRRRGPDTDWIGSPYYNIWIKYFVRYHWCYSFLNSIIIIFTITVYGKVAKSHPLGFEALTVVSQVFVYFTLVLLLIGIICAILATVPRIPLFRTGCRYHCGRLRGQSRDQDDII